MREVLYQGTTLVLVSHDLAAVEATCKRGYWLHNGETVADGPVRDVLRAYRESVDRPAEGSRRIEGRIRVDDVKVLGGDGDLVNADAKVDIELTLEATTAHRTWLYLGVTEGTASPIFVVSPGRELPVQPGRNIIRCSVDRLPLPRGRFYLWVGAYEGSTDGPELIAWQSALPFDVYGPELDESPVAVMRLSPVQVSSNWSLES
jgi:hypothetical protein